MIFQKRRDTERPILDFDFGMVKPLDVLASLDEYYCQAELLRRNYLGLRSQAYEI